MISHNEQGLRGSIADRYVDHKRSELLSTIVDLELVSHSVIPHSLRFWRGKYFTVLPILLKN